MCFLPSFLSFTFFQLQELYPRDCLWKPESGPAGWGAWDLPVGSKFPEHQTSSALAWTSGIGSFSVWSFIPPAFPVQVRLCVETAVQVETRGQRREAGRLGGWWAAVLLRAQCGSGVGALGTVGIGGLSLGPEPASNVEPIGLVGEFGGGCERQRQG